MAIDMIQFILIVVTVLSGISALIAIIIVIWDHFKDDHQLRQQANDFYEAIEYLIFSYYSNLNLKVRIENTNNNEIKENLRNTRVKIRIKHAYYKRFIKYRSESLFRYLGMVYSKDNEDSIINMNSEYVLLSDGQVRFKDPEGDPNNLKELNVVSNPLNIKKEEIKRIYTYLGTLRNYWEEKHYKWLFRPKLKPNLNFFEEFKAIGTEIG